MTTSNTNLGRKIEGIFVINAEMLLECTKTYIEDEAAFYDRKFDIGFIESAGIILREVLGKSLQITDRHNYNETAQLILDTGLHKIKTIPLIGRYSSPGFVKCRVNYDLLKWGSVHAGQESALFENEELIKVSAPYFNWIYGAAEEVMVL